MIIVIHTVVTWLGLISLALMIAVLTFRLPVLIPSTHAPSVYRFEPIGPGIWPLFGGLIAVLVLSSLGDLLLRASEMTGRTVPDVLALLPAVVQRTHYGTVWLVRVWTLVLLIALVLAGGTRDHSAIRVLMLACAVLIAWTWSASGHASDQGDFTVQETTDLLHLLAASLWGGGVFVLGVVLLPVFVARGDMITLAETSRRFSRLAGFAVLVLVLTALYNVRVYTGEFKALWTTGYGVTVLAKIILFYFLILIGGFNRYVSLPLLLHVAGGRLEPPGAAGRIIGMLLDRFRQHLTQPVTLLFRRALLFEAALVAVILLAAAGLKHQTPASHIKHREEQHMQQATLTVKASGIRCGSASLR